jgi:hypothetical protein
MHPGLLVFGLVIIAVVAVAGWAVRANEGRTTTHRRRDAGSTSAPFVGGDAGGYDSGSSTSSGHSHGHPSHHGDGGSFGGGGWFGGGGDGGFGSGGSDGGGGGGGD